MRFLILTITVAALFCAAPAQAAIIFQDDFEKSKLENAGWIFADGFCFQSPWTSPRTEPCSILDLSTDMAHNGAKSLKLTFNGGQGQALSISPPSPGTDRYVRYWFRTVGFTYEASTGTKFVYWRGDSDPTGYPNGVSGNYFGSRNHIFGIQNGTGPCGAPNCFYESPNMAARPLADNTWHCIEEHVKLNTPGVADGVLELWVDGVQTHGYYTELWKSSTTTSTMKWDSWQIIRQSGSGISYIDEFAIGTTRIGCSGNPSADTTPPVAPSGLTLR